MTREAALLATREPVVFIPNRGPHDYSAAERFGSLHYCSEGSLDRWDISQMAREVSESMCASKPSDYILLTSLTSLCSVACAIFARKHGCLNLLIFKDGGYLERTISLDVN